MHGQSPFLGSERNCSIRQTGLSVQSRVILAVLQTSQPSAHEQIAPDPILREDAMREGMSLLLMLSLLTVVLVTIMAVHCGMRNARRKRSKLQSAPTDTTLDPWIEAGKRMDDAPSEFDEPV